MTYHGSYTDRVTGRRRTLHGSNRRAGAWSSGAFIATIVAILVVAVAIIYDVSGSFRTASPNIKPSAHGAIGQPSPVSLGASSSTKRGEFTEWEQARSGFEETR
jgi:hypothetical protein